jgi:AbrB family looped-hinge helix DNA binding protein
LDLLEGEMRSTTLSSKGQVVIPREIRELRGWTPGTVLLIDEEGDGIVLRPLPSFAPTTVDDLLGCVPHAGRARSLQEMEAGVVEGARRSR